MKYVKRPVIIDAIQFTGPEAIEKMCFEWGESFVNALIHDDVADVPVLISTLEGAHVLTKDDWIIRGIEGEFYPVKPHIFPKSYVKANEKVLGLNDEINALTNKIRETMETMAHPILTVKP